MKELWQWLRNLWGKLLAFWRKLMNGIALPTTVDNKIDSTKVTCVLKFTSNGKVYFYCIIENQPHWLNHTDALERWFFDSGITVTSITGEPEIKCVPEDVTNVPPAKRLTPKGI
jgi:hypothetical protein